MTFELILGLMGLSVPIGSWMYYITTLLRDDKKVSEQTNLAVLQLLEMHKNPDKYGFGVGPLDTKLDGIHEALKTLIHYVRWQAEQAIGKEPPPPPPTL